MLLQFDLAPRRSPIEIALGLGSGVLVLAFIMYGELVFASTVRGIQIGADGLATSVLPPRSPWAVGMGLMLLGALLFWALARFLSWMAWVVVALVLALGAIVSVLNFDPKFSENFGRTTLFEVFVGLGSQSFALFIATGVAVISPIVLYQNRSLRRPPATERARPAVGTQRK